MDENTSDFSEFNTKKLIVYILLIIFSIATVIILLTEVSQLSMHSSPKSLYDNATAIANNWNTQAEPEFASLSPITVTSQNGYINGTLAINVTQVPNYKWRPYLPKISDAYYYGYIKTINVTNIFKLMNYSYTTVLYDNIIFTTSKNQSFTVHAPMFYWKLCNYNQITCNSTYHGDPAQWDTVTNACYVLQGTSSFYLELYKDLNGLWQSCQTEFIPQTYLYFNSLNYNVLYFQFVSVYSPQSIFAQTTFYYPEYVRNERTIGFGVTFLALLTIVIALVIYIIFSRTRLYTKRQFDIEAKTGDVVSNVYSI